MKITLTIIIFLIFLGACSEIPDLQEADILAEANQEAIALGKLDRKLMYGMFPLYVDADEEPYTGWTKEIDPDTKAKTLGYLKTGRKEGRWITWAENGTKILEAIWAEDRLEGTYLAWYNNGVLRAKGQTKEGEMDGRWQEFYPDGKIECTTDNRIGHLISIQVWKPDGSFCEESLVNDGNGSYMRYYPDGSLMFKRTFVDGVETKKEDLSAP
jgi:antitoxin component YwqK of YwqJK toxin-antitoxin module